MHSYKCHKECCLIKINTYETDKTIRPRRRNCKKAGIFIYDPIEDRVLLVQSRGQLWGPPKGTLELGENETECAVREVKEETGLIVSPSSFTKAIKIKNKAIYFYMEMSSCAVNVQDHIENNDANGVSWIKVDCLRHCISNGHIILNGHCKIAFRRFMNITFPKSGFTKVVSKRRKKRKESVMDET